MRQTFLFTTLFAGLLIALNAQGTQIIPPSRPMTEGDALAERVANADLIVVGHVRSRYDSVTSITLAKLEVMRQVGIVTLAPTRVLMGEAQPRSMRYLQWVDKRAWPENEKIGDRTTSLDLSDTDAAILFLEDLRKRRVLGLRRMPEDRIAPWATREPQANWTEEYERAVKLEIEMQRPENMAKLADLIVIAHPLDDRWVDPQDWAVERSIKGGTLSRVKVRLVSPKSSREGTNLLFLKRVGSLYEPVRVGGGAVPVRESRVPHWNCSLDEAIARITR